MHCEVDILPITKSINTQAWDEFNIHHITYLMLRIYS